MAQNNFILKINYWRQTWLHLGNQKQHKLALLSWNSACTQKYINTNVGTYAPSPLQLSLACFSTQFSPYEEPNSAPISLGDPFFPFLQHGQMMIWYQLDLKMEEVSFYSSQKSKKITNKDCSDALQCNNGSWLKNMFFQCLFKSWVSLRK